MRLSLEHFREFFGLHPWAFWQWQIPAPHRAACVPVVFEEPWQNADAVSRSEVVAALERAQHTFHAHAGYWPTPRQVEDLHDWPGWPGRRVDTRGRLIELATVDAPVKSLGVETLTKIGTVAVPKLDVDGDSWPNRFEASLALADVPADELELYITDEDRDRAPLSDRWLIKTDNVRDGGDVRFRGGPWQLARPKTMWLATPDGMNPHDCNNYVQQLDVYRRQVVADGTDFDTATFVFEYLSHPCQCGCLHAGDPALVALSFGRGLVKSAEFGRVAVAEATWDATTETWSPVCCGCGVPDRVRVRYLSGPSNESGALATVLRLAAADLPRPLCVCGDKQVGSPALAYWQNDLALVVSQGTRFQVEQKSLSNPIGTRRGQVSAWEWIQDRANARAVA